MPDQAIASPSQPVVDAHLSGAFAPVTDELDVADLPVRGELPDALEGVYLRNGPNPQFPPIGRYTYPFDGDGMIHALDFAGGRVRYRNRWVATRGLAAERRVGHALYGGLSAPRVPDPGVLHPGDEPGPAKNVANANVVSFLGRILAISGSGLPHEVTPALATVGEHDFGGRLPGAMGAHPKLDPIWDELVWFRHDVVPPYLLVGTVGPDGEIRGTVAVDLPDPVLMHDFGVTDRHVVLFDSPAVLDPSAASRGEPLVRWREERGTRVGVLSREATGDETVWIPIESCFAMHVLNAFSLDDTVVVDYIRRRALVLDTVGSGAPENAPRLHRMTLDLATRSARDEMLDDRPCELPRIDERRAGLQHRYGYVAAAAPGGFDAGAGSFGSLVQHDLEHGHATEHRFAPGVVVGEPTFVPDRQRSGETGGWVLAYAYDTGRDSSELVVIDAADFGAPPLAVVTLPRRVPAGSHGCWLPG